MVIGLLGAALAGGLALADRAPPATIGPEVTLDVPSLAADALRSIGRMAAAYALSLGVTLVYGLAAARGRRAERVLLPLLDVLQSVPILSFLPIVLLTLVAAVPEGVAVELAAIVLLFTSQVWNLTFSWIQALTTIPGDLDEAARAFRLGSWLRFRALELPHAAVGLVWNSMMSWAGGWFFLMAAESFTVGSRDFRLRGLGSYLQAAAEAGDARAIALGLLTLGIVIVTLDQFVWRPALAWSHHFRLDLVEGEQAPASWWLHTLRSATGVRRAAAALAAPLVRVDAWLSRRPGPARPSARRPTRWLAWAAAAALAGATGWGALHAGALLLHVTASQWLSVAAGLGATTLRVAAALGLAALWTIPAGVAIGTDPRVASVLQPIVQVAASVPATALFPVLLLGLLGLPFGIEVAAVVLLMLGTQWYLLFNVIAGAAAIPEDLRQTARSLGLRGVLRWRTLLLPALFPHLITGAITASGGAWNASIVAEHIEFEGRTRTTVGIGALVSDATARGDYPLLLASTLAMIAVVVLVNRVVWRRLYRVAETRYRME